MFDFNKVCDGNDKSRNFDLLKFILKEIKNIFIKMIFYNCK